MPGSFPSIDPVTRPEPRAGEGSPRAAELTISEQALAVLRARNQPIHLDLPPVVQGGCCLPSLQERPTVRYGAPEDVAEYVERSIQGITVYVPRRMPREGSFELELSSFLGLKRVVLEGWKPL